MSEHESETQAIDDEQLPDDLVPGEGNPLAEGLEPGETVEGLLDGGKDIEPGDADGGTDGETA